MFKFIVILILVGIAALLIFAATKPNTFRVERTTRINASPEKIFAFVNDFHKWDLWSPYEKMDLTMTKTFSGAALGKGAVYAWEGNKKVGQGRMEIIESVPASKVALKLDFIAPMEAHNMCEITFKAKGATTEVIWAMFGPSSYVMKIMHVFFNMDKMVGKDFETGLANLKVRAEQ